MEFETGEVRIGRDPMLELHFDRAMDGRIAIFGDVPKIAGKPAWDDAKRVLRIPVVLEAGARYRMRLNGDGEGGFASDAGERLAPRDWTFEVDAAAPEEAGGKKGV